MHYLALHGFTGEVVPINPRRSVVQGRPCYPRIADAPPIDVAVVAVPAKSVAQTVKECAEAGVKCCVIISSGFAEIGGAGTAAQEELARIARASGMRLVGPNCLGLINLRNGMALTSARVLDVDRIIPGHIGLVSQSGALMLSVYNRAHDQGIGFSQLVSVGNQADLDICDFFEHMIGDPVTEAICLHIEGLRDGHRFLDLLGRAREAGKPALVLKTGRSAKGQETAKSHTASLAGAYPVFAAACREAGSILVDDPDVMALTANLLTRFGPVPEGAVGVVSSSGGLNGIVADRLADLAIPMAIFSEETRQALASVMLPTHLDNPVDLGARRQELGEGFAVAQEVAQFAASDANVGIAIVPMTTAPSYEATVSALVEGLKESGKPHFFIVTPGSVATSVRALLRERRVPYCDRLDDGMRVLRAYLDYRPGAWLRPECRRRAPLAAPRSGYLTEPEAKELLAAYGVTVPRERCVRSRDEAVAAAAELGFPVVLKGVSDRIVHKSDAGLVRPGLADRASVAAAFDAVRAALDVLDPQAKDCLVAEMARGEVELIIGAKRDPQFGSVVLVGAGGVLVDLVGDVEVGLAPLSADGADAMLRRLRVWPLLAGYRSNPALDVAAVVTTLVKVSELATDLAGVLLELDINPLMVRRAGEGVTAVDARAVMMEKQS
jgi:acetyl-CoA synthetase (ADP-forming)